jgi:hypothetical protein
MLVCDFCGERITDFPVMMVGASDTTTPVKPGEPAPPAARLDFHKECVSQFTQQAATIKGTRPKEVKP